AAPEADRHRACGVRADAGADRAGAARARGVPRRRWRGRDPAVGRHLRRPARATARCAHPRIGPGGGAGMTTALPLDGIVVTTLEQAVAAPLATRQFADLGARVIKIERPDGGDFARDYDHIVEGMSANFVWLNRGKESVQLDLKSPEGTDSLHRLLDRSDVVVSNLAPAARARLGLTAEALRERYPRLIGCFVAGYRSGGPNETRKAYDALIQAEAGVMSITGSPGAPAKAGPSVADIAAGTQAANGVLAAI